jgi:hypothetical protein
MGVSFAPLLLNFEDDRAAMQAALEAAREPGLHDFPAGAILRVTNDVGEVVASIPLVRLHS